MLTSVSKDVSNWVTGNEVSAMMLLSAVRRTVRRFSQFYTQRHERTCNDSDMLNNNPICIGMQNTCDGNM